MEEETRIEYVKPEVVDLGPAASAYGGIDCRTGTTAPGGSCQDGTGASGCLYGNSPSTLVLGPRTTP